MLVSVVIPTYNVEEYIEECLDSVFSQTYSEIEVVVVDNASTDNTYSLLSKYKEERKKDFTLLVEHNQGAPFARNAGLNVAKGEWVQFLDADDLLRPTKIEHQVELLKTQNVKPSFIAGAYSKNFISGNIVVKALSNKNPFITLFEGGLGNTCSNLWNKEYLIQVGGWNTKLKSSQEPDLMFRMMKLKQGVLVDHQALTIIRERPSGQISNRSLGNRTRFVELRVEILDYLKSNHPEIVKLNEDRINQVFFYCVINMMRQDVDIAAEYYKIVPSNFSPKGGMKYKALKRLMDLFGVKFVVRILKMFKI